MRKKRLEGCSSDDFIDESERDERAKSFSDMSNERSASNIFIDEFEGNGTELAKSKTDPFGCN